MAKPEVTEESVKSKSEKGSRGQFPRLPLNGILALPKQVYELGEGDPVPRLVVFDRLGKSPSSSGSRMLVTTSAAYGLTTGSYQADRLGITDRGRAFAQAEDQGSVRALAVKTLLDNPLFSQFYEKYQNKMVPQEPVAVDYLKQVANMAEVDAKAAYKVFMANLTDFGFIQEMSGRSTIVSQDLMDLNDIPAANTTTTEVSTTDGREERVTPSKGKRVGSAAASVVPQFNFNIQVQLPDNATAEAYDAIFKSMSEHLLKTSGE